MIAAFAFLNGNKNIVGAALLVLLGVTIVAGSIRVGVKLERNKNAAEAAETNTAIVEARGKDEAELDAEAKAAKTIDDAVKANLKQTLILNDGTAKLLGSVK